jgi:hypothetical protein
MGNATVHPKANGTSSLRRQRALSRAQGILIASYVLAGNALDGGFVEAVDCLADVGPFFRALSVGD